MKYLILCLALLLPAYAVEDDGNAATRRARFTWEQTPPEPAITTLWSTAGLALTASRSYTLLLQFNLSINKWEYLSFTGGFT